MTSLSPLLPVTIVTGFLGSGKTTLLNHLLRRPDLADTAVIVNEFGEIGIDHLLIEQAIENTVLLKNGCVCCTVRGDVADTLDTLFRQREAGEIPRFARIVIETTGLADPGPVAHAIAESAHCRLAGIVTSIDAMHPQTLSDHHEARRQIALADRLLITKTDLAPGTAPLEATLRQLNAQAPIRRIAHGQADPADLFALDPQSDPHHWLHGHHHHHDTINTVLLTHDGAIPWPRLTRWLNSILSLRGDKILRLKGLLHLEGEPLPKVLQAVHHVIHPLETLPAWPQAPRTDIVVITDGLSPTGLSYSFTDSLA